MWPSSFISTETFLELKYEKAAKFLAWGEQTCSSVYFIKPKKLNISDVEQGVRIGINLINKQETLDRCLTHTECCDSLRSPELPENSAQAAHSCLCVFASAHECLLVFLSGQILVSFVKAPLQFYCLNTGLAISSLTRPKITAGVVPIKLWASEAEAAKLPPQPRTHSGLMTFLRVFGHFRVQSLSLNEAACQGETCVINTFN